MNVCLPACGILDRIANQPMVATSSRVGSENGYDAGPHAAPQEERGLLLSKSTDGETDHFSLRVAMWPRFELDCGQPHYPKVPIMVLRRTGSSLVVGPSQQPHSSAKPTASQVLLTHIFPLSLWLLPQPCHLASARLGPQYSESRQTTMPPSSGDGKHSPSKSSRTNWRTLIARLRASPAQSLWLAAIFLTATACFAWTILIILLLVAPTAVVNWIMDTEHFDNGAFWLLPALPTSIEVVGVLGLSITAMGYLSVLLRVSSTMISIGDRFASSKMSFRSSITAVSSRVVSFSRRMSEPSSQRSPALQQVVDLMIGFSSADSSSRKIVVSHLKRSECSIRVAHTGLILCPLRTWCSRSPTSLSREHCCTRFSRLGYRCGLSASLQRSSFSTPSSAQ